MKGWPTRTGETHGVGVGVGAGAGAGSGAGSGSAPCASGSIVRRRVPVQRAYIKKSSLQARKGARSVLFRSLYQITSPLEALEVWISAASWSKTQGFGLVKVS